MATPQKKQQYDDPEVFANKLVEALASVGVTVTRGQPASQRAIAPAKSTSSAPATTRSTTSQPYKVPGKYDPFPNQGAGMGARTKAWSPEAQAIGQGSARGVTGQRPAQVGNTMQGGFTRGPGGMPQRSGPPLGRPAPPGPASSAPMLGGGSLGPIMQNRPMNRQLPNSPILPGMSMGPQEWRPPMVGGPVGMPAPTYVNPLIDNQDAAWPTEQPNQQAWNPYSLWSMITGR